MAAVPGCIHTDLRKHGLIPDPFWGSNEGLLQWIEEVDWRYRCKFQVDAGQLSQEHIELVAEGLDTVADIRLNDRRIARVENMFTIHRLDISGRLRPGINELEIRFGSPLKYIRARQKPGRR